MSINGKTYPLWEQFVERQEQWIGGTLQDFGDSMDRAIFGEGGMKTKITGIELKSNGEDSAYFSILGEDFNCGFDVHHGGISGAKSDKEEWLNFRGYGGHSFRIKQPA